MISKFLLSLLENCCPNFNSTKFFVLSVLSKLNVFHFGFYKKSPQLKNTHNFDSEVFAITYGLINLTLILFIF